MDKENLEQNDGAWKMESNGCLSMSKQVDHFIGNFSKRKNDIESELLRAEQIQNREKLSTHLIHINEEFQTLQRYLADATTYLPLYNIRVAQDSLKHLQENIYATQEKVLPKKKFAFKNKKVQSSSKDLVDGPKLNQQRKTLEIDFFECGFKNLQNQELDMQPEDVNGKDVGLHGLEHCTIQIKGCASTVHLSQLTNCRIYLGPVSTSVFIDGCQLCTFVVACQQLRVHCTTDCAIYLHVTSKAIVEDCSKLRFAPYNWNYEGIENHYKISGLDPLRNNWNDIDDFNWLTKDVPSPNWSIMPVQDCSETH